MRTDNYLSLVEASLTLFDGKGVLAMEHAHNSLTSVLNTLTFVHTEVDLERFRARERKATVVAGMIASLVFLSLLVKTLPSLIQHVQARDWWSLGGDLLSSWPYVFLLVTAPTVWRRFWGMSSLPMQVLELRGKLGNEQLVPPLAEQPLPLEAGDLPVAPMRIGPVRRVKLLSFVFLGVSTFLFFFDVVLGALVLTLLPWLQVPFSTTPNLWVALAVSVPFLGCAICTVLFLVLALRLLRADKVAVDAWGLRWTWPNVVKGRSVALAWYEITGFYEITNQELPGKPIKMYVLDGLDSTFMWFLREKSTQQERQASLFLSRLIITRTGLPLCNLTSALEPLLHPIPEADERAEAGISLSQ